MKKTPDINTVAEAVDRCVNTKAGDSIIVRAISLTVPSPSYDMAITNATMHLLLENFNRDKEKPGKYTMSMLDEGQYEVAVIFHLRKVGKPVNLLN